MAEGAAGGRFRFRLGPGETRRFSLLFPYFPISTAAPALPNAEGAEVRLERLRTEWRQRLNGWFLVDIPERKPLEMAQASRAILLCGGVSRFGEIALVGESPWKGGVWSGGANAAMIEALDFAGEFDLAGLAIRALIASDFGASGRGAQDLDAVGQALSAIFRHAALAPDSQKQALELMAGVERGMEKLRQGFATQAGDALGPIPVSSDPGREMLERARPLGAALWMLAGARAATRTAELAGLRKKSQTWDALAGQMSQAIEPALRKAAAEAGGVLPPAFEGAEALGIVLRGERVRGRQGERGGLDWGNVLGACLSGTLAPDDPTIERSLAEWGRWTVESLFPYPFGGDAALGSPVLTAAIARMRLRRGEAQAALQALYEGLLVHSSATHGMPSVANLRSRGFFPVDDPLPSAEAAAAYLGLFRDLFLYEDRGEDCLWLFEGANPAWLREGRPVRVLRAPCEYGTISMRMTADAEGGALDLEGEWRREPRYLGLKSPFGRKIRSASADGAALEGDGARGWRLPPDARQIRLVWDEGPERAAGLSYERIIEERLARNQ
ncbi:MAG: hypothetical protein BWZ10_02653 [candidate division BRC1 bacterium ADurb.BinA364]|nr:MAG: hypothetical protein BWZ10_02653 [candidate division BRC1 bacterium ADurb.BinA364]